MRTIAALSSLALASCAFATPRLTTVYGQTYAEVGNPGNADYTYEVYPGAPIRSIGGVKHRYRIAVTEVTRTQWAEFANAITPFLNDQEYFNSDFAPSLTFEFVNGRPEFSPVAGHENFPARMGWRWAARYCNWLHNGKALTADAFESGAYDSSTFGTEIGEFGFEEYTDQSSRSKGARFWIPSEDEWVKAAYYDPNRFGEGEGGYWQYPGMSDDPLVTAPPDQGGETNAGGRKYQGTGEVPFDVGSYPNAASYYGMLDASGGATEWTETWGHNLFERSRVLLGTSYLYDQNEFGPTDLLSVRLRTTGTPDGGAVGGLRLAMVVPTPGVGMPALVGCFAIAPRRR